ncbi:adenylyltransferase/cytidyltransferase family protein [Ruficoccus amylovorans]|uniref:Adenylyltransferase/cytidyltransferase family protein n=1 Tax=Ruficoccus amylovorans TaxID=1804625 RepID=A0A842HHU0_9BACT|nr:adenylyltransferase/cytidyltransferase family protein [Ruficoccus amylovorans]MBC2596325.1 adenylyltransferase/cytidyltransferase family protein [Ruficoccus amylovorans]
MALPLDIPKLLSLDEAARRREAARQAGEKVVLTNGCFDLLHTGHLYFLKEAAKQGDRLYVALNGDASVQALKGPTRPVQSEQERAYLMGSLPFIDTLVIFHTPRLTREIEALRPDLYVKAGDYNLGSLNPEEHAALDACGAEIRFLPFLQGYSTTSLIAKIRAAADTF